MEEKKYIRLLRPVKRITFNALYVYSYLFSRPRKRGYSQRFLARYLGLAVNTIASVRDRLLGLKLIHLTPRRRLKASDPPADMFHKTKGNDLAYTKVILPSNACPLTTKQNAVYWCWKKNKDLGRGIGGKTAARFLGISLNFAKVALKKAYAYNPQPDHYQNKRLKLVSESKERALVQRLRAADYTESQINEVMGMAGQDDSLVARLFKEVEATNRFDNFANSFHLLIHKLKKHRERPIPDQPYTLEELENQKPIDPFTYMPRDERFDYWWFSGRVDDFSSLWFNRWVKEYSQQVLVDVLRSIEFHKPLSASDFDQRLKSYAPSANGKA
jgi:hypothetical protein